MNYLPRNAKPEALESEALKEIEIPAISGVLYAKDGPEVKQALAIMTGQLNAISRRLEEFIAKEKAAGATP